MGRPNDLFGPETLDDAAPPPRPSKKPEPTPEPKDTGDDGLITVSAMDHVALVFIGLSGIRECHTEMIQRRLITVADKCRGRLAVSLSEVVSLNSSAINALVAVHARCAELGGHLALFALSHDVRRVFKVTKLDRKVTLADNAHEAVQSFTRPKKSFLKGAFTWARQERDAA